MSIRKFELLHTRANSKRLVLRVIHLQKKLILPVQRQGFQVWIRSRSLPRVTQIPKCYRAVEFNNVLIYRAAVSFNPKAVDGRHVLDVIDISCNCCNQVRVRSCLAIQIITARATNDDVTSVRSLYSIVSTPCVDPSPHAMHGVRL